MRPSEVSRDIVHVELRDSTSMSPDCSAAKRLEASSGVNVTLLGSPKIAAAIALQISTSSPVHLFLSPRLEKPSNPCPTPQLSVPRALTAVRVCARTAGLPATSAARSTAAVKAKGRLMQSGILVSQLVERSCSKPRSGRRLFATSKHTPLTWINAGEVHREQGLLDQRTWGLFWLTARCQVPP